MLRLGYDRFGAQGGDWGSMVTTALALGHPTHLAGIHLNMPIAPPDMENMDDLTELELSAMSGLDDYMNQRERVLHAAVDEAADSRLRARRLSLWARWPGSPRSSGPGVTTTATPRRRSAPIVSSTT